MTTIGNTKAIRSRAGKPRLKEKEQPWLGWLLGGVIVIAVFMLGSPVLGSCERAEMRGPVSCTFQTRLLGIIPLQEKTVYDVQGARLHSIPGDEYCDPCYRVELETAQGVVPLREVYTNGNSGMNMMVDKVAVFVQGEEPGKIDIHEPGLLSFENLFCFVGWVLAYYVWEKIKSVFGRKKEVKPE